LPALPRRAESVRIAPLTREDVDLDRAGLQIGASLQRLPWQHGCPESRPCGGKLGADCPARHSGGLRRMLRKTAAGIRTIPLPLQLVGEMRGDLARQAAERLAAGPLWRDGGWVFAGPLGAPIDYSADWRNGGALWRRPESGLCACTTFGTPRRREWATAERASAP
jgi:hypothetical protein